MKPIRIIIAKVGLDGHDRGAKVVARTLREAGCEVHYTGLHQTPESIASRAIQVNAAAIGISILSGAHLTLFPEVLAELAHRDASAIKVFGGGVIPTDDAQALKDAGVSAIFTSGTSMHEILDWVERELG
jgi:methylmalonyl-CoA mutase C-terminal domain/subunit